MRTESHCQERFVLPKELQRVGIRAYPMSIILGAVPSGSSLKKKKQRHAHAVPCLLLSGSTLRGTWKYFYFLLIKILRNSKIFDFCYGSKFPNGYSLPFIISWPLPRTNIPRARTLVDYHQRANVLKELDRPSIISI